MKRIIFIITALILFMLLFSACTNLSNLGSAFAKNLSSKNHNNNINTTSGTSKSSLGSNNSNEESKTANSASQPKTEARSILKAGDKGDDVKDIQKLLNKFGYTVAEDGSFGNETVYAVMDFQHRHGLTTDGIVQGSTLDDLKKDPTADVMYTASAQVVSNTNASVVESIVNETNTQSYTNYYIMVNISEQMVYIFNGTNGNWKLINSFQCASGTGGTPTITGHFFVGIKGPQFRSGQAILKYYTQIQGNYLFHSVLFDKNGNLLDGTLGKSASHGCVRLALENAKYIYDNVPIGSGIWIK